MLWWQLAREGIINNPAGLQRVRHGEINIIMDNCTGQNKNRMVVRFLFVLVHLKITLRARLVFLLKGHTKNDCDQTF